MKRGLGVLAIALSLLGCSAQASISASAGSSGDGAQTAGAEALQPRESDWDKESREEAAVAERAGTPVHETGAVDSAAEATAPDAAVTAPPAKARRGKKHSRAKARRSNAGGAAIAAASHEATSDRNRGHGNDLDGVDEDNPGKSKK